MIARAATVGGVFAVVAGTVAGAQPEPTGFPASLPITVQAPAKPGSGIVLLISGETGPASYDIALVRVLSAAGIGAVTVDTRSYLASRKSPQRAAAELGAALRWYSSRWQRPRILVVGYSRGADIAPFIANRLSDDLRERLDGVVLVGPAGRASFALKLMDVVGAPARATDLPVLPELERLRGIPIACTYGRSERQSFCMRIDSTLATIATHEGGHRVTPAIAVTVARLVERLAAVRANDRDSLTPRSPERPNEQRGRPPA